MPGCGWVEGQTHIEEATFHRNDRNSWRPKMSLLLSSFVKCALLISITIRRRIFSSFIWMDACIVDTHFQFKEDPMAFGFLRDPSPPLLFVLNQMT